MAKTVLTLSQTVVRTVTCERCGARYEYDHLIEEKATVEPGLHGESEARAKAEAAMLKTIETGSKIVPCPRCKALTKSMRTEHLMIPMFLLVFIGLCLGGAFLVMWIAEKSGALFWWLGLLALAGAGMGVLALLAWPFGVFKDRIGRLVE